MKLNILVFAVLIVSCASHDISDPKMRRELAKIKIFENRPAPNDVEVVKAIKGTSCGMTTFGNGASKEEALVGIKVEALNLDQDIDGIQNVVCTDTGMRVIPCARSWTCYGDAYKTKTKTIVKR